MAIDSSLSCFAVSLFGFSVLFDEFIYLLSCYDGSRVIPAANVFPFECLVQLNRQLIVIGVIKEYSQGQLSWTASAVPELKAGWAMVPDFE
jgi:hypothetical protein